MVIINNFVSGFLRRLSRDYLQILLLVLSKFKRIDKLLLSPKSPENRRGFDDFRGNRRLLIHFNYRRNLETIPQFKKAI